MKKIPLQLKSGLTLLTLTTFFCVSGPARAQSAPAQDNRSAQDRDTTRAELASFDSFLDNHREIAEQIRKNPSLVNSEEFVRTHPALRDYLQAHPGVREEIRENPNAFMRAENRFDRREDARNGNRPGADRDITRAELQSFSTFLDNHRKLADELRKDPSLVNNKEYVENHPELATYLRYHTSVSEELSENPNAFMRAESTFNRGDGDTTRRELASYDRFLDSHKEIAEQLRKNPYLVDNQEYIKTHPALQEYLQNHPDVQQEIHEDPTAFLEAEHRYDTREDARDNDTTRRELASFDGFLDKHREISEQLRKNPSLVNNPDFVKNHPALETFLQNNPGVRQEIRENPNAFMQQEARYDQQEGGFDRDRREGKLVDSSMHRRFGEFLGGHSDLAQQLAKNPAQVKNQEFLERHPELKEYLSAHPDVRQQLMANPDLFIKSSQQFTTGNEAAKPPAPKPKPNQ